MSAGDAPRHHLHPLELIAVSWRTARMEPARVIVPGLVIFGLDAIQGTFYTEVAVDHLGVGSLIGAVLFGASALGLTFYAGMLERLVGSVERNEAPQPVTHVLRTLPWGRLLIAEGILIVLGAVASVLLIVPGLIIGTLFALVGPLINLLDSSVPDAFKRSLQLVWPHFMLVFLIITLPLALEHEVVVFVAELIPHEHIWTYCRPTWSCTIRPIRSDHPRRDRRARKHHDKRSNPTTEATQHRPKTKTHPRRPTMEETIHGTTMPVLELSLADGESVVSEAGEFSWMSDAVQMATNTGGGMGGKGLMGAVKRAVSGASIMMTTYTAQGGTGSIAFASKVPGHILPIDVAPGNEFMVHRHGFMAATPGIELSMGFQQSFRGGIFGGEGFILQKISGTGRAFVDLSGEVLVYDLAEGQTMRVHPGHAGLFQASVQFTTQKVPGLANRYMGSDGHHFAVLTGPGRIWLQSMPLPILAGVIGEYMPDRDDHRGAEGVAAGIGGAKILGDMFK